ncbi:hypothetical protein ATANTOWER_019673 [Ataeniobius toweri]|uniref:Uncharacterized protein n=1 Tax=Ataeniobius toweri TaxID=208326 RepID=A0ABU7CAE3_9TELE|nr:hypothetical protein [Ataeniobius toweri]
MSWEREANVPFHLKQHTHTHTHTVRVQCQWAGECPCAGMRRNDKLWRCRGRDSGCYSQTPKNTPPCLHLLSSFHSCLLSSLLSLMFLLVFMNVISLFNTSTFALVHATGSSMI